MSHNRSKHQPVNFFKLLQTIHIPRHDIPIRQNNNIVKPHPTAQDLAITEPSNPTEADSHDLTNAIHRFRGLANGDYSKDFDEETDRSRLYPENLQTDVDEIFENFDKCYQASYPKTSQASSSTNLTIESRPVCRELLRELSTEPASTKPTKNIQKQPIKKSTPQQISKQIQPKEFPTLKTGQYFSAKPSLVSNEEYASVKQTGEDVKTVRANGGKQLEKYYTAGVRFLSQPMKLKVVNKTLEESKFSDDKENLGGATGNRDSEESKPKAHKTFMFVQNSAFSMIDTNYRVVQETLKKIRNHDTGGKDTTKNKDAKEILTDITNDERPTRRALLKENGELRPLSSGATGRRKNPVQEIHHKREEPERVSYNSLNKGRINIPEMIHYKQAKENLCPAGAKPVNTRFQEVQRESIKAAEKMIANRRNSVGGIGRGAQETKLKKIVGGNTNNTSNVEKRPVRHERNSTDVGISKEDITRYFALAKRNIKNISNGDKNTGSRRSLSGARW